MIPIKYDIDGTPMFTCLQVEDYGLPEEWGFSRYLVIEDGSTNTFVSDYKMESEYDKRSIHRYDLRKRFENTLLQLMGEKGKVPEHITNIVGQYMGKEDPWNDVRRILKHYKLRIYYDRIPFIIQKCLHKKSVDSNFKMEKLNELMEDFDRFVYLFEQRKKEFGREYMINLRFVALKLLDKHGFKINYPIPITRTKRIRKQLENIWNIVYDIK